MCRIFAYSGDVGSEGFTQAVSEFAKLARDGNVPQGIPPGHLDGWGLHASTQDKEVYVREVHEATAESLLRALAPLGGGQGQVLMHLRKATIGENKIVNTHPFVRGGAVFCHNGSIRSFPDSRDDLLEGGTDSEKYFVRILSQLSNLELETMCAAVESEVEALQDGDWTSLTCLLKSSRGIVVKYLWNESHPMTEVGKLHDYYTFYKGMKGADTILCSEKLSINGYDWESLANGTTLALSSK